MKKAILATAAALTLAGAPVIAQETKSADPFVASQGLPPAAALGIAAGLGVVLIIVAAEDTD